MFFLSADNIKCLRSNRNEGLASDEQLKLIKVKKGFVYVWILCLRAKIPQK